MKQGPGVAAAASTSSMATGTNAASAGSPSTNEVAELQGVPVDAKKMTFRDAVKLDAKLKVRHIKCAISQEHLIRFACIDTVSNSVVMKSLLFNSAMLAYPIYARYSASINNHSSLQGLASLAVNNFTRMVCL